MSSATELPSHRASALRWAGAAQLQAWQSRLQTCLDAWCRAWGAPAVQVQCANAWDMPAGPDIVWQAVPRGAEAIAWFGAVVTPPASRLPALLFGDAPLAANGQDRSLPSIAQEVSSEAWRALCDAIGELPDASVDRGVASLAAPPADDLRPWSGAIRARIRLGTGSPEEWWLHIPDAVVPAHGGVAPSRSEPFSPPVAKNFLAAIRQRSFALHGHLQGITVALSELLDLQQGDVLLSSHALSMPLALIDADGSQPVFAAYLAQHHENLALVLSADSLAQIVPAAVPASSNFSPILAMQPNQPGNASSSSAAPAAQLLSFPEAAASPAGGAALPPLSNPLLGVKVELQVRVGSAVMTVGELSQARAGQVVKLDRLVDGPVDLLLDGQVVARGQLVAVDDCFGVRLTELPQPLTLPAASKP